ncbi:MAG: hypothetical protein R3190_14955, partial [Thermoanaerobaculia bacterium]|nr:hypothetical protein [Thermoanaerobaculia bacterium]
MNAKRTPLVILVALVAGLACGGGESTTAAPEAASAATTGAPAGTPATGSEAEGGRFVTEVTGDI